MNCKLFLVALLIVLALVQGDTETIMWKLQQNYANMVVDIGDTVEWLFSTAHKVSQFRDATAFDNCDFSSATLKADSDVGGGSGTSPNKFSMTFDTAGTYYFGCPVDGHCLAGMKVQIVVAAATVVSSTDTPSTDTQESQSTQEETVISTEVNTQTNTDNTQTNTDNTEMNTDNTEMNTDTAEENNTVSSTGVDTSTYSTVINTCNDDSCCQNLENGNPQTGAGYMEYSSACNNGGLHCVSNIGCRLCYKPVEGGKNVGNRPTCARFGGGLYNPTENCDDQACCEKHQAPNESDGNGYLEFWQACASDPNGVINCIQEHKGCRLCYRPVNGGTNIGNRPICGRFV